jgi:folate-binding protein YgfZ
MTDDFQLHASQARGGLDESLTVYDLSDRTQIDIAGADMSKFLHGFCTNDIKSLSPGQGCEAFLTNIKGRVLGHVFVFAGVESLALDTVAGQEQAMIAHLDRYLIREDVQLIGQSQARGELFVTGPHAHSLLMLDEGLAPYGSVCRQDLRIRRADILGTPGYLLSLPREALSSTRDSLIGIGCRMGTAEEFECRRIEAGFPYFGPDISEDNLAQEVARTKQCISFTKGCYLGQEPIARLDAMGHTNRELRRIRFDRDPGPAGSVLHATDSDDEAGRITSVAPSCGKPGSFAAMAYVKTRWSAPDLMVRVAETSATGTVLCH